MHQVTGRVFGIGIDIDSDAAAHAGTLQSAKGGGQFGGVGRAVNRGQFVVQRLHPCALDGFLVEEAGVEVADALRIGAYRSTCLAGLDDQVSHLCLGAVEQATEGAVGRSVRWYLVFSQPAPVNVAEQVVLGSGISVDVAQVDTRGDGKCHPAILPPLFGCNDRAMPDGEQSQPPAQEDAEDDSRPDAAEAAAAEPKSSAGPMFSTYGIASTLLGVLSVAAVVLGAMIWSAHRDDSGERTYLTRVMLTAAEWTAVLINMNADNIDASLQRLHDGTVGQLNTDFDAVVQPYRQVVEKLRTHSSGRIEAVAIDTVHRELDTQSGAARPVVTTKLPPFATRTDSVLLVATSVSENAGAKPQTVHWNLRLDVSDVDGKLMISRLESIR